MPQTQLTYEMQRPKRKDRLKQLHSNIKYQNLCQVTQAIEPEKSLAILRFVFLCQLGLLNLGLLEKDFDI